MQDFKKIAGLPDPQKIERILSKFQWTLSENLRIIGPLSKMAVLPVFEVGLPGPAAGSPVFPHPFSV